MGSNPTLFSMFDFFDWLLKLVIDNYWSLFHVALGVLGIVGITQLVINLLLTNVEVFWNLFSSNNFSVFVKFMKEWAELSDKVFALEKSSLPASLVNSFRKLLVLPKRSFGDPQDENALECILEFNKIKDRIEDLYHEMFEFSKIAGSLSKENAKAGLDFFSSEFDRITNDVTRLEKKYCVYAEDFLPDSMSDITINFSNYYQIIYDNVEMAHTRWYGFFDFLYTNLISSPENPYAWIITISAFGLGGAIYYKSKIIAATSAGTGVAAALAKFFKEILVGQKDSSVKKTALKKWNERPAAPQDSSKMEKENEEQNASENIFRKEESDPQLPAGLQVRQQLEKILALESIERDLGDMNGIAPQDQRNVQILAEALWNTDFWEASRNLYAQRGMDDIYWVDDGELHILVVSLNGREYFVYKEKEQTPGSRLKVAFKRDDRRAFIVSL